MPSTAVVRVTHPDNEFRCQGIVANGQCLNEAARDDAGQIIGKMCIMHGGAIDIKNQRAEISRNYKLVKYADRVHNFATNPSVKSLREEIGVLRMLVEEHINQIQDPLSLVTKSGPISEMVAKIERLVRTCHQLEKESGIVLDKSKVMEICDSVINATLNAVESLSLTDDKKALVLGQLSKDLEKIFKGDAVARTV